MVVVIHAVVVQANPVFLSGFVDTYIYDDGLGGGYLCPKQSCQGLYP